jgi:predicted membrane GTPase involved in stress response
MIKSINSIKQNPLENLNLTKQKKLKSKATHVILKLTTKWKRMEKNHRTHVRVNFVNQSQSLKPVDR